MLKTTPLSYSRDQKLLLRHSVIILSRRKMENLKFLKYGNQYGQTPAFQRFISQNEWMTSCGDPTWLSISTRRYLRFPIGYGTATNTWKICSIWYVLWHALNIWIRSFALSLPDIPCNNHPFEIIGELWNVWPLENIHQNPIFIKI